MDTLLSATSAIASRRRSSPTRYGCTIGFRWVCGEPNRPDQANFLVVAKGKRRRTETRRHIADSAFGACREP